MFQLSPSDASIRDSCRRELDEAKEEARKMNAAILASVCASRSNIVALCFLLTPIVFLQCTFCYVV